ncbi:DUF4192 domain-containing protein [Corynebacterium comes]|uniref:DUF4192 domain-containing protein n=1 Tax=Corynebacterium comes TaxID=2675218 RepID=A0A6B8VXC0_9CORY|nr:DUF4192 domain-containing protein [Corynebacterium comes]QGU04791.1 hypothetical protein CETAM_07685 [Corynebacterium comes]
MTALSSPGQLAANLPGILGFYPHDSVIFAAFDSTGAQNRFRLGPVIRLDIDDLRHLPDVARTLDESGEDLIFAFVVTRRSEEEIEEIIDTLLALVRTCIMPIHACWVTPEILTGEPVQIAFGPAPVPGEENWSEVWFDDVIAPVVQAQAMASLLANGMLPDLNREETFEQFARFNPSFTPTECDQLSDFAHRHSHSLLNAPDRGGVAGLAADIGLLLTEIEEQDLTVADLMADEETLLTIGVVLGNATLRDIIIEDTLRQAAPAARILLAAARTFDGIVRLNALALYAVCALELKLPMRAMPALAAVLVEDPGHTLSVLLLDACRAGAFDTLLQAVREGSRMVRTAHDITDGVGLEAA